MLHNEGLPLHMYIAGCYLCSTVPRQCGMLNQGLAQSQAFVFTRAQHISVLKRRIRPSSGP